MIAERLADRAAALEAERIPYVQAVVVRAARPASVQVGATALVHRDGSIEGFVGGHCAEPSVRLHALRVLETGEALLLRIEPGPGDQDAIDGAVTVHNPCISGGALEIFLEPHLPKPRLRVVGDTPIATALAELGRSAGFHVGDDAAADDAAVVVASPRPRRGGGAGRGARGRSPVCRPRRQPQARPRGDRGPRGGGPRTGPHPRRPRHRRPHAGGDRALDPRRDRGHPPAPHHTAGARRARPSSLS